MSALKLFEHVIRHDGAIVIVSTTTGPVGEPRIVLNMPGGSRGVSVPIGALDEIVRSLRAAARHIRAGDATARHAREDPA